MYDRIVTSKFKPEELDEATKIMTESIIPAQKEQKGWKGTRVLIDREKSKIIALISWNTKEDALKVAQEGFMKKQMAKISPYLTGEPTIELREVLIDETNGST
ncbi:MAG: hypothetical protein ACXAB2_07175 [Candidatus Hodarchaeales archaeon]|jgi:quinol monooxygenase YgiN